MKAIDRLRKEYLTYEKWYYHLVFDSIGDKNLLNNRTQCVNAMNAVAVGQFISGVSIIQFDWMRNHGHFVLRGDGRQCCHFFDYNRSRLNSALIKEGYTSIPEDWFFRLIRLDTLDRLVNAVSYSARNSYDARNDILPSGYLWSSNYLIFSEISLLLEYETISGIGPVKARRLLGSRVELPGDYKICKLGYVLPESYLMMSPGGKITKAQSLYKDSKDYAYKMFRDYNTYRHTAMDMGESWSPTGGDLNTLIDSLLSFGYGVSKVEELSKDQLYELATKLTTVYGIGSEEVALRLKASSSMISRMAYSYSKKNRR